MPLRLLVVLIVFALCSFAEAQQPKKIPRIGFLVPATAVSIRANLDAFWQGLRELGYVEGKNIVIEYRYAEEKFDRLPALAAELVRLKVDVIFAPPTSAALPANNATNKIPIIIATAADPVGSGLIASLAHPGGNVTGVSNLLELSGKQLELLKEAFPRVTRVAVLWDPANTANTRLLGEMKVAAGPLRVTLQALEVRSSDDFDLAFSAIKKEHASALIVLRNVITYTYRGVYS